MTKTQKLQAAFEAGQHCGLNGPDETNCDFRHFVTPERAAEWERGNALGKAQKTSRPSRPSRDPAS